MTETKPTPKAQAERLINEILKGKDVHGIFAEMMNKQIMISGHPIPHWEKQFKMKIPTSNLNPQTCRDLDLQLLGLNELATFFYNAAVAKNQALKHSNEAVYMSKFQALVEEYKITGKRLPASSTLDNLARVEQLEVEASQTIADIEVKFWKSILDHLGRCQSILKNASLMIATELKAMSNERNLDAIERNYNNMNGGS